MTSDRKGPSGPAGFGLQSAAILAALLFWAGAVWAQGEWSTEAFEALLPGSDDHWQAGALDLEELKTVSSDLEDMLGGLTEADVGTSVRIKLSRKYSSGEKVIGLTVYSSDIQSAAVVESAWKNDVVRQELAKQGITRRKFGARNGLAHEAEGDAGWAVAVGETGVVTLECAYANCADDLEGLFSKLDFARVERFVAFDHRR